MKRVSLAVVVTLILCLAAFTTVKAGPKVVICHIPPGNPANAHEIEIDDNAVPAHLDHGDNLGTCGGDDGGDDGDDDPPVDGDF
jgi:hypothetical protein